MTEPFALALIFSLVFLIALFGAFCKPERHMYFNPESEDE
jgi:hypothetical protein